MQSQGFGHTHANAVVSYFRGSPTSRRFETVTDYLDELDKPRRSTLAGTLATVRHEFPGAEVVVAWNKPMA